MNKHTRLLYMFNCLSTHHGVSVSDLAKRCRVSERTIYRDVKCILQAGYPIYYHGGYRVLEPASKLPGQLSQRELGVLKDILEQARNNRRAEDADVLLSIGAKIERAIAENSAAASPPRRFRLRRRGTGRWV